MHCIGSMGSQVIRSAIKGIYFDRSRVRALDIFFKKKFSQQQQQQKRESIFMYYNDSSQTNFNKLSYEFSMNNKFKATLPPYRNTRAIGFFPQL
jgi:hypothetical protein